MKHLSSKVLSVIVACSAAVLLNVNVHAANVQIQPPAVKRSRSLSNQTGRNPKVSKLLMLQDQKSHHYVYRNLNSGKDQQSSVLRLGSYRGRRHSGKVKRTNRKSRRKVQAKKSNRRRRNRKARRHVIHRTNRHSHRTQRRVNRSRNKVKARQNKTHQNKTKSRQNKKSANKPRRPKYPRLVKPREWVINQKKSAVNRFKKNIRYVHNQQPTNFKSPGNYGDSDYARKGTPITGTTGDNNTVTFNQLTFIPKKLNDNQFYSPQGLVIDGHYAYVINNATNSYEASHDDDTDDNKQAPTSYINGDLDTGTSPYKPGASQIIRINLNGHVKDYNEDLKAARRNIKIGPVFYGGHGQGFAYNPRNHQLWLLNNKAGQVTKTAVSLINPRTLLPSLRINFHFGDTTIGDDLAFVKNGQALNVTEAGDDSFVTPGAIKFFKGSITPRGVHMKLIKQALQWAPSNVIQGTSYNRRNNRFYILGDDSITSVPVNRLGRLRSGDVWNTQFNTTREFEGLSFDNSGNGYLLTSRSPEILMSKYDGSLHF